MMQSLHMKGPIIHDDLFSILVRIRFYKFAICNYIEKICRQAEVRRADQNRQRILWFNDDDDNITDHLLTTVTYGLTASSYLAIRGLKELAENEGHKYPLVAAALLHGLTGASTTEEAGELGPLHVGLYFKAYSNVIPMLIFSSILKKKLVP